MVIFQSFFVCLPEGNPMAACFLGYPQCLWQVVHRKNMGTIWTNDDEALVRGVHDFQTNPYIHPKSNGEPGCVYQLINWKGPLALGYNGYGKGLSQVFVSHGDTNGIGIEATICWDIMEI